MSLSIKSESIINSLLLLFFSLILSGLLGLTIPQTLAAEQRKNSSLKIGIFVYHPDQKETNLTINKRIKKLSDQYQNALYWLYLDISKEQNTKLMAKIISSVEKEDIKAPAILIGDAYLTGLESINARLSEEVERTIEDSSAINPFREKKDSDLNIFLILLALLLFLVVLLGVFKILKLKNTQSKNGTGGRTTDLIKNLVGKGGKSIDLLNEINRILYWHNKKGTTSKDVIPLIDDLLHILRTSLNLSPIEKFHEEVKYDPRIHQAFDVLEEQEIALVVSSGWRINEKIVKRAIVRKLEEKQ